MDAKRVAAGLRTAYETADLDALSELLHPEVRWGGEEDTPDTCHSRSDVLTWYRRGYESGMRATVTEVLTRPEAVFLALRVSGRAPGTDVLRQDPAAVRGLYDAFAAEIDAHAGSGPRKVSHGLNDTLLNSLE
ncbi:MAG TPA: nuclear transport factor 2 family protein, partial [Pseudonocardiaceae bacterium]